MSDAQNRIAEIVKNNEIVLFMKGTPLFPQCGFSSRAIAILDRLGFRSRTQIAVWAAEHRPEHEPLDFSER